MLPAIFIYGIGTQAGVLYYLVSFIVFIFTPIIPLSIAAIASVLIMRFVNLKREKDLNTVIVSILALIFFFTIQFFISRISQNGEQQAIENFILQNANLAKMISRSFPPALWGAVSMTDYNTLSGVLNLLMFIAASIIFTAILAVSVQKMYLKTVISGQEVEAKRKEVSLKKEIVRSSLFKALLLREWKLLIRIPVYAMNVLLMAVIIPFVFLVSFVGNRQIGLEMAIKYTSAPDAWFWVSMIGLFFSLFVAGSDSLSSTSFSREGKMFYISKLMPVNPVIQLKAKWIFGIIITLMVILPTYVLSWYIFKIHLLSIVILTVLMLIGISAVNILSLMIDAMRPSFEWENPQKAMKGNLNVVLSLILTIILIGCIAGIVFLLKKLYVSELIITLIIGILLILLNLCVYLLAKSAVKKLYKGE
jgi:ABC-2 type transport system permease protein